MIDESKAADPGRFVYLDPFLIEQRRINLGLSRTRLIQNMAVAPNTIKGVFRGTAILADTAFRLAKQLRCEVNELLSHLDERYVAPAMVAGPMAGASEWEMDHYLEQGRLASNGLYYVVCRMKHRFTTTRTARGKFYHLGLMNPKMRTTLQDKLSRHAEVCARVGLHPNVAHNLTSTPAVGDAGWWVIDHWVGEQTLADRLESGAWPPADLPRLLLDVAMGLQALHTASVIFRELAPARVLISDQDGRAVLTDFELAKLLDGSPIDTALDLTGVLSSVSVVPGTSISLSGSASWLANLTSAGAAAGEQLTVSISGTGLAETTFTNSNGQYGLAFDAPVVPGDYLANVTVSDLTSDAILVLPFTVTAPLSGIDLYTRTGLVTVSDTSPVAGSSVTLNARIYNVGADDFIGSATVHFYDGASLIGSDALTNLASGAFTNITLSHAFTSVGSHAVTAIVDQDNLIVENSELNNSGSVNLTVLDTIADLSPVDILFSDSTPATTDTITLTVRVINTGGTAASNVLVQFYDEGNALGAAVIPNIAADGGTEFVSIQAVLPTAGLRQITVVVDGTNSIPETDETTNTRSEVADVHAPIADFQASSITLSSTSPLANESIDVDMAITNLGEIDAHNFDVQFLKDGIAYGTVHVTTLAASGTTVVSLPTSFTTVGPHTISVVVDSAAAVAELSESNNTAFRNLQVLATPLPDLQIVASEFILSNTNPGTGDSVTVSVQVRNRGLATAIGVTAQLQIDGVVVGSAAATPADINAGQQGTWEFVFTAPAGDGFHLLEIVVDEANLVGETNENNNRDFLQFLVGDHPDLVTSNLVFSNETPGEGDVVTISATVTNEGADAATDFVVRILDGSQQIGQVTVPGLAVGASQSVSVLFDTTGRVGLRLIQVIADPGNQITEVNEGNNLISHFLQVSPADAVAPTTVAAASVAANGAGWNNSDVEVLLVATDNVGGVGVGSLKYSIDGGPVQTTFGTTQSIVLSSEGVHAITFQAVDLANNIEALQSLTVRIDKTAPTAVHCGPFTVEEGSTVQLGGADSTDNLSGVAEYLWDINTNNIFDASAYTGLDGPSQQTVALRVVDVAGNETIVVTHVTVTNASPEFEAGPGAVLLPAVQGAFSRPSVAFTDAGQADVHTLTVNFGDNTGDQVLVLPTGDRDFNLAHTYTQEGLFIVTVSIEDDDGATAADSFDVEVLLNTAPESATDANSAGNEVDEGAPNGTLVGVTALAFDADGDTLVYQLTNDAGGRFQIDSASGIVTVADGNLLDGPSSHVITVEARDPSGEFSTADFTITVNNVAPTVGTSTAAVSADEGATAANTGTFGDIGNDTVAITASVGTVTQNNTNGTWAWSFGTNDGPDQSHTVTITATDSDGAVTTISFDLTVNNVAPTVGTNTAAVSADEGATAANTGTFGDIGNDTVAITASVGTVTQNDTNGTWAWSFDTNDGPDQSQTVTIIATDNDGAVTTTTFDLTVNNVAPTVGTNTAAVSADEGTTASNTGTFYDVGNDTVLITASVGTVTQNDTDGTWAWSFDTNDGPDQSQTVTITATDSDGAVTTTSFDLTVNNVAPVLQPAVFSIVENSANGTVVGSMTAADAGNDALTFSITGGTGAAVFGIDATTGSITVTDQLELDFETYPSFTLEIRVTDDEGAFDSKLVTINLMNLATVSGVVFVDTDHDGLFDANEMGIDGTVVELLDSDGDLLFSTISQDGGLYFFEDLQPGFYQVREVQPTGVTDGPEHLGSVGGIVVANDIMALTVSNADAADYSFAEFGQQVGSGDTAGIGFWQNKHGQELITLGGTALSQWLTTNFGNIFGNEFINATGSDVAAFYKVELFKEKGQKSAGPAKLDAQFMSVALATFFTSRNLAGEVAGDYGFNVSDTGIGTSIVNVGSSGIAFGVADDTELTIMQLLLATNASTDTPDNQLGFASIYDQNGDGVIDSWEARLRTAAHRIFSSLNS